MAGYIADENKPLTPKQEAFCHEWMVDRNGSAAAVRTGFSVRSAKTYAAKLLALPQVKLRIAELQAESAKRLEITADRLDLETARIAFFDPRKLFNAEGKLIPITELDDDTVAAIAGLDIAELWGGKEDGQIGQVKKFKIASKLDALQLLMKRLGLLTDKIDHTSGGEPVVIYIPENGRESG